MYFMLVSILDQISDSIKLLPLGKSLKCLCLSFGFLSDCLGVGYFPSSDLLVLEAGSVPGFNWFSNQAPLLGSVSVQKVCRLTKGTRQLSQINEKLRHTTKQNA